MGGERRVRLGDRKCLGILGRGIGRGIWGWWVFFGLEWRVFWFFLGVVFRFGGCGLSFCGVGVDE